MHDLSSHDKIKYLEMHLVMGIEAAPAQIKWDGKEIEIMARRYT